MGPRADDLAARILAERETLVALCADLVAARSDQPTGDTRAPAAVLARFLEARGIATRTLARAPEKANLVATVEGAAGPGPTLALNGHLDTLPVGADADWTVPRFAMGRGEGRLTGLGIGNMKAGVAALAGAVAALAAAREAWRGRIVLTAVADEVVFGEDGAAFLLETAPDVVGDALICAEGPGAMGLALAEKGLLWLELVATAPAGQGMLARRGTTATARLARLLAELDSWNDEVVAPPPGLEALGPHAGAHGLRLSVNVGVVAGGAFVSQVATSARAEVDVRIPPGLLADAVEARVRASAAAIGDVAVRRIKGWDPNWTTPDARIVRAVADAAAAQRGEPARPVVRLPASDAARWRARGVPALCFGPQALEASGPDDFVFERDLVDCAAIYARAALAFLAQEG